MVGIILKFNHGKTPMEFDIVHNLDEYRLDILAALINWSVRTKEFTVESFCEYVVSKDVCLYCVPRTQWDAEQKKKSNKRLRWRHRYNEDNV